MSIAHRKYMNVGLQQYCGKDKVYFILIIHLGNTIMIGNMQHIMRYCISQGTTLNVVAFVSQPELSDTVYNGPWATECDSTELIDAHSNWEPRVSEFLKVGFNFQTYFVYWRTLPSLEMRYVYNKLKSSCHKTFICRRTQWPHIKVLGQVRQLK